MYICAPMYVYIYIYMYICLLSPPPEEPAQRDAGHGHDRVDHAIEGVGQPGRPVMLIYATMIYTPPNYCLT